jgi:hypothetical protein
MKRLLLTTLAIAPLLALAPLITSAAYANVTGTSGYPACNVLLNSPDPTGGTTPTTGTYLWMNYQLQCNGLDTNAVRISVVVPFEGGNLVFSLIGGASTTGITGSTTEAPCTLTGPNEFTPANAAETVSVVTPGTTYTTATMTCSPDVQNYAYGAYWYDSTVTNVTAPDGMTDNLSTAGGVNIFELLTGTAGTPMTDGTALITSEFGGSTPCTPTGVTGFYSKDANGSNSFNYTTNWTGPATEIALAPNDTGSGTTTVHGKTFPNDTTFDASPTNGADTLSVTPNAGTDPNQSEFWCWSGYAWSDMGNALSAGSGLTPASDTNPGCTLVSITGARNFQTPTAATQYNYLITTKASKDTEVLAIDPNDGGTGSYTPPDTTGHTFTSDTEWYLGPSATQLMTVAVTGGPGTYLDPIFWCYDSATSTWTNWGDANSLTGPGQWLFGCQDPNNLNCGPTSVGSGVSEGQCIADVTAGLGWNPATDVFQIVFGGARMIGCEIQYLFIPDHWTSGALISSISHKVPLSYVTDTASAATTIASAINSSTAIGSCSPPNIAPFATSSGYLHTFASFNLAFPEPGDLCSVSTPSYDTNLGEIFGYRTWFRDFLAIGIWLTTVLLIWRMMPWSRPGDGVEVVTAIGKADGYTLMSDHSVRKDSEDWS